MVTNPEKPENPVKRKNWFIFGNGEKFTGILTNSVFGSCRPGFAGSFLIFAGRFLIFAGSFLDSASNFLDFASRFLDFASNFLGSPGINKKKRATPATLFLVYYNSNICLSNATNVRQKNDLCKS